MFFANYTCCSSFSGERPYTPFLVHSFTRLTFFREMYGCFERMNSECEAPYPCSDQAFHIFPDGIDDGIKAFCKGRGEFFPEKDLPADLDAVDAFKPWHVETG